MILDLRINKSMGLESMQAWTYTKSKDPVLKGNHTLCWPNFMQKNNIRDGKKSNIDKSLREGKY